jgi:hypothetical protein
MKSYILLPGLLLLAATACTESAAPEFTEPVANVTADLELALPALRQLVGPSTTEHAYDITNAEPLSANGVAYSVINPDEIPQEYLDAAAGPLIRRLEVDVGFMDDVNVAYAQSIMESTGSYYKNHVGLNVYYGNTRVGSSDAEVEESCLCAHLFSPWGQIVSTTVSLSGNCGHRADAYGKGTASLDFMTPVLKPIRLGFEVQAASNSKSQQACPTSSTPGSSGGAGGDDEWYICYWEDYYDANGDFIRRQDLGCAPINAE